MDVTTLALARKYTDEKSRGKKVYGVLWDKGADPTLVRTNDAIGMVANIGIDDQLVRNDFDNAEIYHKIHDVTDSLGNIFVRIPKFYIRKIDGAGFKSLQISETKYEGFYLPWCFWDFGKNRELPYVDVGKYKATLSSDNKLESKAGGYPLVSRNIVQFRDYARNNNVDGLKGYQQLDVHVVDILQTLFYVEFATLDSQSIMQGLVSSDMAWDNGFSADIKASSGTIVANDGKTPCMYRGIESPWGDVWQFVDGININDHQAWVAKNAEDYASNLFNAPYEQLGYVNNNANGYTIEMGFDPNLPFAEFPKTVGGSTTTYYSDYYYQNSGARIARVGGYWAYGANAGVSYWYFYVSSSIAYSYIGGRLLKKAL